MRTGGVIATEPGNEAASMAATGDAAFLRATGRTFVGLGADVEREWRGSFYFVQAADPQLGLMKAWRDGDCNTPGYEWAEEVALTRKAVRAVNRLAPRPRFMVLCGDLVHALPDMECREEQERDLKEALRATSPDVPLVFVSGNHDLGNTPTAETVAQYCRSWGDDYFSFWVGGVLCLVLNSQLYYDHSACPELGRAQEAWLEERLQEAERLRPRHILVFQHIPLYLRRPDEDDDYFNLQKGVRERLRERFCRAGVKAVFSGHYHRNAGGCHDGLDMVVSSAIGCQLGEDMHGVRIVVVTADRVVHRYHSLDRLAESGVEAELKQLLS
ncbi:serine/threonine-protein phosphatase CPPED1 [Denticeps clupeoides]|uniref:Serine/threonine-protein phosphatase CPPED1 n=1 Tax=Denticeps clupeoides TaxID=299321 RepID=A0AAY4ASN0_9TELE|nr:serine/threonine-protein phosphatase CPPED1 [Denticeps clupeoides]